MATLSFEGDTHREIVRQVRRWLESTAGAPEAPDEAPPVVRAAAEAVERVSDLAKDALTVVAERAPEPVARNDVVQALTRMGYDATDATRRAVVSALDALAGGDDGVVKRVQQARNNVVYEMESAMARQVLRALRGR